MCPNVTNSEKFRKNSNYNDHIDSLKDLPFYCIRACIHSIHQEINGPFRQFFAAATTPAHAYIIPDLLFHSSKCEVLNSSIFSHSKVRKVVLFFQKDHATP